SSQAEREGRADPVADRANSEGVEAQPVEPAVQLADPQQADALCPADDPGQAARVRLAVGPAEREMRCTQRAVVHAHAQEHGPRAVRAPGLGGSDETATDRR